MNEVLFKKIDVFTKIPYKGNPVAVVFNGDDFSTNQMQMIANWMNLSETTFICKPTHPSADYKLRIFSPKSELPFAGHPTIGSAFAFLKLNTTKKTQKKLIQECGKGLVTLNLDNEEIYFSLPKFNISNVSSNELNLLANALGIDSVDILRSATIEIGASWITLQLVSGSLINKIQPNIEEIAKLTKHVTGLTIFGINKKNSRGKDIVVRSFAPNEGANEDPVCGSGNGCAAILIKKENILKQENYTASQGMCIGREGKVKVIYKKNGDILIGGDAVECIDGSLKF